MCHLSTPLKVTMVHTRDQSETPPTTRLVVEKGDQVKPAFLLLECCGEVGYIPEAAAKEEIDAMRFFTRLEE